MRLSRLSSLATESPLSLLNGYGCEIAERHSNASFSTISAAAEILVRGTTYRLRPTSTDIDSAFATDSSGFCCYAARVVEKGLEHESSEIFHSNEHGSCSSRNGTLCSRGHARAGHAHAPARLSRNGRPAIRSGRTAHASSSTAKPQAPIASFDQDAEPDPGSAATNAADPAGPAQADGHNSKQCCVESAATPPADARGDGGYTSKAGSANDGYSEAAV